MHSQHKPQQNPASPDNAPEFSQAGQLIEPVYGLCSRELPPGLVQAMQQSLSRSQDWERLGSGRRSS